MEQAMRNIERMRALRIDALRRIEPAKPTRGLSAYFSVRPLKAKAGPARRGIKGRA